MTRTTRFWIFQYPLNSTEKPDFFRASLKQAVRLFPLGARLPSSLSDEPARCAPGGPLASAGLPFHGTALQLVHEAANRSMRRSREAVEIRLRTGVRPFPRRWDGTCRIQALGWVWIVRATPCAETSGPAAVSVTPLFGQILVRVRAAGPV